MQKIVAEKYFELELEVPIRDRHARGTDSFVGEYEIGACVLEYDAGMYSGWIEPNAPDGRNDFRYRVAPLDGRVAAWATYRLTKHPSEPTRLFTVELHVPSLKIQVFCPTATARNQAVDWLARIHFISSPAKQAIVGPSTWAPAPKLCAQTTQTLRDMADARVRISAPEGTQLLMVKGPDLEEVSAWPDGPSIERAIGVGNYTVQVTSGGQTVRCDDVEVRAGTRTEVRVDRYVITDPIPEPTPYVAWYGRSVVMSPQSERRTYFLSRATERVSLAIVSETSANHHLDSSEPMVWREPTTEYFAGTVHDTPAGSELELTRLGGLQRSHPSRIPDHDRWTCHTVQLRVREASSKPQHVGPVSATACIGSASKWLPADEQMTAAWSCGPVSVYGGEGEIAFTPDLTIELAGEWNDCHIQTKAYRAIP